MASVKEKTNSHAFHAYKGPNKIRTRTRIRGLIKAMLSVRSLKNSRWAEPLTVPWLDQA